jgi:2-polyprenyl-3-methyl-5-hydroxy-6-metoxy-1,4-benzoquinol methylase
MSRSISEFATDPLQYDSDEILWHEEGHGLSPVRRVFLEQLNPYLEDAAGKGVLDVGCGQGWLSHEFAAHGARVLGIDPSKKNIQAATQQYPDIQFERSNLQSFQGQKQFDLVAAVMVFEHLADPSDGFTKIRSLLKPGGSLTMIIADFDKATRQRHDYGLQTERLAPGEVATRTDYGNVLE